MIQETQLQQSSVGAREKYLFKKLTAQLGDLESYVLGLAQMSGTNAVTLVNGDGSTKTQSLTEAIQDLWQYSTVAYESLNFIMTFLFPTAQTAPATIQALQIQQDDLSEYYTPVESLRPITDPVQTLQEQVITVDGTLTIHTNQIATLDSDLNTFSNDLTSLEQQTSALDTTMNTTMGSGLPSVKYVAENVENFSFVDATTPAYSTAFEGIEGLKALVTFIANLCQPLTTATFDLEQYNSTLNLFSKDWESYIVGYNPTTEENFITFTPHTYEQVQGFVLVVSRIIDLLKEMDIALQGGYYDTLGQFIDTTRQNIDLHSGYISTNAANVTAIQNQLFGVPLEDVQQIQPMISDISALQGFQAAVEDAQVDIVDLQTRLDYPTLPYEAVRDQVIAFVAQIDDLATRVGTLETNIGIVAPVGSIIVWYHTTIPVNYWLCDGRTFEILDYPGLSSALGGASSIPDLRGYFLRGLDLAASVDPDGASRAIGNIQADANKAHTHTYNDVAFMEGTGYTAWNKKGCGNNDNDNEPWYRTINNDLSGDPNNPDIHIPTSSSGSSEARPKNVAVNFIIRVQ